MMGATFEGMGVVMVDGIRPRGRGMNVESGSRYSDDPHDVSRNLTDCERHG
jgi:hypothetical protein